ncbi:MAG: hypothetical protein QM689_11840 [Oscillospiraceae bacterium]
MGKKLAAICAACVLLGGCSAGKDDSGKAQTTAATVQTTAVTTAQTTAVTTAQTTPSKLDAAREKLLAAVKKKCPGWEAGQVQCGDFNSDGAYELFVYMKNPDAGEYDAAGAYYFAGKGGVNCLIDALYNAPLDVTVCKLGAQQMLLMNVSQGGASSYAYAWLVKPDGGLKKFEFDDEFVYYAGGMEFTSSSTDYDALTDWTGHTWKAYYYYWDGAQFREYGGIEVTREQFLKAGGAAGYLEQIKKDGGTLGKIFYRANGIVNINYTVENRNENMTLVLADGVVSEKLAEVDEGLLKPIGSYQGIYVVAVHPEFATYPDEFPVK